ncbi:ABC transporter ATPase, partial [Escherichia coli]
MTTGNKVTPTSTSAQARVMLYQASQRPSLMEADWMETSFGRCRIKGRLGQRHADVVEAILHCAERR